MSVSVICMKIKAFKSYIGCLLEAFVSRKIGCVIIIPLRCICTKQPGTADIEETHNEETSKLKPLISLMSSNSPLPRYIILVELAKDTARKVSSISSAVYFKLHRALVLNNYNLLFHHPL